MRIEQIHSWNITPEEAVKLQGELAKQVQIQPVDLTHIQTVAGVDVSMGQDSPLFTAGVVVMRLDTLEMIERTAAQQIGAFAYIPGLLSFREIPVLAEALRQVKTDVDVILVDGHGIAHPRRLGIASHLGLLLQKPTIGVAKSRLIGRYQEPDYEKGKRAPLHDNNDLLGYVLRTKTNVKPLFISPGHLIDHDAAVELTLRCVMRYRLPEPTRLAHQWVNEVRKDPSTL